jgi:hypothetical protein
MGPSKIRHINLITRLSIVLLALFLADKGIGMIMRHLYFSQQSGDGYLINYTIDSTRADIVVLGSSRAKHTYVPGIFYDSLKLTCFNAGRDGTHHVLFNCAQFRLITKRYNPGLVIFDIRPEDLGYSPDEYDMLAPLLPFYKDHPEIRNVLNKKSPYEKFKHISTIYPYNSLIFQVIMGNTEFNKERKQHSNGFVPFYGSKLTGPADSVYIPDSGIDVYKLNLLEEVMATCNDRDIKLLFVYSPTWNYRGQSRYDTLLANMCDEHSIDYINMSNLSLFMENSGYFFDRTHLNEEGATVFSSILAGEILKSERLYAIH